MRFFQLLFLSALFSSQAFALEFWQSDTDKTPSADGSCTAAFTFDNAALDRIHDLRVEFVLVRSTGEVASTDTLDVDSFGPQGTSRYAFAFMDSPAVCEGGAIVSVRKASANINGKTVDLIATRQLSARVFVPLRIRIDGRPHGL